MYDICLSILMKERCKGGSKKVGRENEGRKERRREDERRKPGKKNE